MISRSDPLAYLTAELDALTAAGLRRTLRVVEGRQQAFATIDGRTVVNLSSNNYLGLTTHPRLVDRALEADSRVRRWVRLGAHHRRNDVAARGA